MGLQYNKKKLEMVAKKYGLRFVIVHGSYVTGKQRPDSDLDIAVLGKKELGTDEFLNLRSYFAELFGESVERAMDFKTLHRVDPLFRYEVVRTSELIYGDAADYEAFKAFAQNAYDDARQLFELEEKLIEKYQRHLRSLGYAQ